MDNVTQIPQANPQPNLSNPVPVSPTISVQPQVYQQPNIDPPKKKSILKKILIIIGILFLLGVAYFGYLMFQGFSNGPKVKAAIISFLQATSNNEIDKAYSLTTSSFREKISKADFTKSTIDFKAQNTGFKDLEETGFNINAYPDHLQYVFSGIITYDDGEKGKVVAILVKEKGEWKIFNIDIGVSVERMKKFLQQNKDSVLGVSTSN
jgi:hypothetical protein